jgi:GntR family transcriptional regulator
MAGLDQVVDLRSFTVPEIPGYLRVANDLRARIASGEFPPGAKLPSETNLIAEYGPGASRIVIKNAIGILKGERLVEGHPGSGYFVPVPHVRLVRQAHARGMRTDDGQSTSPFARDAQRAGLTGRWEHHSEHTTAPDVIAGRLGVATDTAVMRTGYRFLANDVPVQLSTSWEPLELTVSTPVEWPEDGAAVGVVARFDTINIRIDECAEHVTMRPASPSEIEALDLPLRGAHVIAIERTYYSAGRPVETADIVLSDRYDLRYRYPID